MSMEYSGICDITDSNRDMDAGEHLDNETCADDNAHSLDGLLSKSESDTSLLISAAADGCADVVKGLLSEKVAVDIRGADNITPLMYATYYGHLSTVTALLDAGAHLNLESDEGMTAVMYAAMANHLDIARCLVMYRADVDGQYGAGKSALQLAHDRGLTEMISVLRSDDDKQFS